MQRPSQSAARSRPAFSAVELMIVIVIIGLLAGILIPVLGKAYKTSLASADAALIAQITTGLEMYNHAFYVYPDSNAAGTWPPPPIPSTGTIADTLPLTGAAKAYAALGGFNTVGTATSIGCDGTDTTLWRYPCGQLTFRGILVPDAPGSTTERQPPYGPYYTPSEKQQGRVTVSGGVNPIRQDVFASRFARTLPVGVSLPADAGGAPILYYRANPAPAPSRIGALPARDIVNSWDVFDFHDNYLITNPLAPPLMVARWWTHPLYAPSDGATIPNTSYGPDAGGNLNLAAAVSRWYGITRPFTKDSTSAIYAPGFKTPPEPMIPYNANSYVLISPGPDGLYFTLDDVTNFK